MPHRDIQAEIEKLNLLRGAPPREAAARLRKALADRVNLVTAKAARLVAELKLVDLVPDLLRAFERLLENGAERDPQCWGKNAIAKALVDLDHRESAPFLSGMRHIQMEATWGKSEDMAQNLRGICVLALAACTDIPRPHILRHLVDALTDAAPTVRVEALRAIEQMDGEEAALVLRLKAHLGDEEPPVIGQAFDSLLHLESERALPFVAGFLNAPSQEIREEAALSLGTSRLPGALEILRQALAAGSSPEFRPVLLRAISSSRQEEALAFLLALVRDGEAAALEALALHRASPDIRARVEQTVQGAGPRIGRLFGELFPSQ